VNRIGDWEGVRVAVWGAAKSGIAAANLLAELGADVVLSDSRAESALALVGLDRRVAVRGGGNVLDGARVLVPSPGIPPGAPAMAAARADGVRLVSEIELAASVASAPIVAITGTDGKSTTTAMIGAVVEAAGRPVVVAGNIGDPLSAHARDVDADGVVVAEVSAFQLWTCGYFRPRVSVVTNVAPDHADYFAGDWAAYVAAKARVLSDQGEGDTAVLRADDPIVAAMATPPGVARALFSPKSLAPGWGFADGHLTRDGVAVMGADELPVHGAHNVANALAALAAGAALGLPLEAMVEGLRGFRPLPHRLERVAERRGVVYLDDSKATNPHAAAVGLRSLSMPLVVIAGGYDKGLDQAMFVDELVRRARHVVLVGGTAARTDAEIAGRVPTTVEPDMDHAVRRAAALAQPGDVVVLSPAASSFDLYRDYHHRGHVFQAAVRALPDA
jgi:UDP-N-acetylmuramoylalanine--D-glutamate ligase